MITAPDPNARNTERYRSDLTFRAAADAAHFKAMQHSRTLQMLIAPCAFVPEDCNWQNDWLADATCSAATDY